MDAFHTVKCSNIMLGTYISIFLIDTPVTAGETNGRQLMIKHSNRSENQGNTIFNKTHKIRLHCHKTEILYLSVYISLAHESLYHG